MKKIKFDNGLKLLYEYREGNISSFCIGFNAGALEEEGYSLGIAHAVEHMVFKGTEKRSEAQINKLCDEVFGFHNAMTNYPYAIYYGTTHSGDFEKGFEIYSDIVLNPVFPEEGFEEEINVIIEELKEWKEDLEQHCEDLLFSRAFAGRRIKELIIGSDEAVRSITLTELKDFYERFYSPGNCVISVVSSLSEKEVVDVVKRHFLTWDKNFKGIGQEFYEENTIGVFSKEENISGAKIKYCFPIHMLNEGEIEVLSVFNSIFGDGVSSILYDEIRTKYGLAYEVYSELKIERGIKLFNIYVSLSKHNIEKALELIQGKLEEARNIFIHIDLIKKAEKRLRLKRELAIEKSIELCKKLTTYELMFGSGEKVFEELKPSSSITPYGVNAVVNKVLKDAAIMILK